MVTYYLTSARSPDLLVVDIQVDKEIKSTLVNNWVGITAAGFLYSAVLKCKYCSSPF